jgi:hypothetical protein
LEEKCAKLVSIRFIPPAAVAHSFSMAPKGLERAVERPTFDSNIAALADFMAGYVYQSTIMSGNPERNVRMNSFDVFAQHSWQATRKLNVNLGLRYEYEGPIHDGQKDLSVFNPALGGLVVAGQQVADLYPKYLESYQPARGLGISTGKKQ